MIASVEHGFVFLKTRKTAGTSIEIALSRVCGADDVITPISPEDEELRAEVGGRKPQHYTSPPLKVRVFNHARARRVRRAIGEEQWDTSFRFAVERNPWDTAVSAYFWSFRPERVANPPTFEEFLRLEQLSHLADNAKIYRIGDEIAVHRVLRYESLDSELPALWQELSLPGDPDIPRAKSGPRPAGRSYQEMYATPWARDRVAELFSTTIEEFGYEF